MREDILSQSFNKNQTEGISLVGQWLRICTSIVGGMGSTPGLGAKISHTSCCGQKKKKKRGRVQKLLCVCLLVS